MREIITLFTAVAVFFVSSFILAFIAGIVLGGNGKGNINAPPWITYVILLFGVFCAAYYLYTSTNH